MKQQDHTKFIAVVVLIGIIVTVTLAVATNSYNNSQNVERDKYYAEHCKSVTKVTNTSLPTIKYECSG